MKYPGQPEAPPSWYQDRGQSHIEKEFSENLEELANAIENEKWFGSSENHSRYRVDFLLKDARLIIELDGHEYHSTQEQRERDAIRQRYLSRAGYTIIRFTGREINRSASGCVSEVRTIYRERLQLAPAKYRVMYIGHPFL
jgi:very-short-patch-repair endonuclease